MGLNHLLPYLYFADVKYKTPAYTPRRSAFQSDHSTVYRNPTAPCVQTHSTNFWPLVVISRIGPDFLINHFIHRSSCVFALSSRLSFSASGPSVHYRTQ